MRRRLTCETPALREPTYMTTRFLLAALAYIVPTFPLGYLWHLVIFKSYYASLLVYRPDISRLAWHRW